MKYLSTFTGIGGFEYGIHKVIDRAECVGYSEVDKYAVQTYERHYEHQSFGDITTINPADLPDFELLVGGFPCQAFSIAGQKRGFEEARGTLFFDVARILEHKRPRHIVLENVRGLLSHESGETFQTILRILTDLGYRVEWQLFNSKWYLPQKRERIYIVGHLTGQCLRQILPIGEIRSPHAPEEDIAKGEGERLRRRYISATIDANYHKGAGATRQMIQDDRGYRKLTPIECERLQGFPDDWTAGVSDTQRYRQCGNAVTTDVVAAIMSQLKGCIA